MAIINILEPSVFNKIAAGEVVDRPASIVKELVENSIDAGSTMIVVEIENGGISCIEVSDNGCGIEKSEVKKAFLPHSTSKIKTAEDLEDIVTLGFRGEALASIAAVSQVTLITKHNQDETGTQIEVSGGEFGEQIDKGSPCGTYIKVKNLFYNIPVRQRFLKKPKQEESEVSEIISRLILANPEVAIKFIADGKIVYNSNGKSLSDAIYAVYGANTLQNLIHISNEKDDLIIDGYIGKPSFTKPNRTYQTVIINGRYVTSPLINAALSRVYEDYMLKRAYPFYVLNIQMPPEMVDVNVHPNKKEVKFQDSQQIFGFVLHTVDDALIESRNNINENEPSRLKADEIFSKNNSYNDEQKCALSDENNTYSDDKTGVSDDFIQKDTDLINLENSINALSNITFMQNFNTTPNISESSNDVMSEIILDKLNNISQLGQPLEPDKKEIEKFQPKPILNQFMFKNIEGDLSRQEVKIVGKIFNTFIIVEVSEKVYIIDQHAAHERMLYDSLLLSLKKVETCAQPLLLPYMLEVNNKEKQFILDNLENIEKLGFEIELFGNNSFKISTIPYNLPDLQISEFFSKVLQDMDTILNLKDKDLVLEHLAQTACKHAVKGGDDLKDEEIWALLSKVATQGVQLQCPHGRPFVIELKRSDVDKWFKRIV